MPLPTITYIRTSHDEPDLDEYGLAVQQQRCEEYCAAHDLVPIKVIQDDITSKLLARPGLDEAREMLRTGQARAIVCSRLDRLIRTTPHLWILRDEFAAEGVELHFADSGISRDDPTGRLGENIRAVIAEYERELIIDKTRAARIQKARSGKWVGQSGAPYGHARSGKGKGATLSIDPQQSQAVRDMVAMLLGRPGGLDLERCLPAKLGEIAAALFAHGVQPPGAGTRVGRHRGASSEGPDTWYASTVRQVLARRTLLGEFSYMGHVVRLPELAIIDEATFDAVQQQLRLNAGTAVRNRKREYLLAGHIRCACGGALAGSTVHAGKDRYYQCSDKSKRRPALRDLCRRWRIAAPVAERAVWDWVQTDVLESGAVERAIDAAVRDSSATRAPRESRLAALRERVARGQRQMERWLQEFGAEESQAVAETLRAQIRRTAADVDAAQAEIAQIDRELSRPAIVDAAALLAAAAKIRTLPRASYADKRAVLAAIDVRCQLVILDAGAPMASRYALDATCAVLPGITARLLLCA